MRTWAWGMGIQGYGDTDTGTWAHGNVVMWAQAYGDMEM